MGTQKFVESITSRYTSQRPHREVPHQRGLVGRIDPKMIVDQSCDIEKYRQASRLYGTDKENRDCLLYFLWQRGGSTNGEIGDLFGVTYTAVSHSVKKVKDQLKTDRIFKQKYEKYNSQIKM